MDRIRGILSGLLGFIFDKVVFAYHFNVGVFNVDAARTTESNCDGTVASKEGPPDAFPQAFVLLTELRLLNTAHKSITEQNTRWTKAHLRCIPEP